MLAPRTGAGNSHRNTGRDPVRLRQVDHVHLAKRWLGAVPLQRRNSPPLQDHRRRFHLGTRTRRRVPWSTAGGGGYGSIVAKGSDLAVVVAGQRLAIATSSDNGLTWETHRVPNQWREWGVKLLDPSHWRFVDSLNLVVQSTDDAGQHWRTQALPKILHQSQSVDLAVLPPRLTWAISYRT